MKYMLILFFILLTNCSFYKAEFWTKEEKIATIEKDNKLFEKEEILDRQLVLNFNEEMTFEEFKIKLEEYSNNSPYPDINN